VESEPADRKAHDCVRIQTVLVVDDEASIREMLATVMELDGYRVLQAHDGRRALEVLAAEDVNVVTLDVMMPGMDGWEVADLMQVDPRFRSIPRVMISGKPLDELMRACGATQAAAVLSKPLDVATLSALIEKLLAQAPQIPTPRMARRADCCAQPHRGS
jgi:CheY-like chemotaxis protein